ncbi:MAG: PEGA domain-containing protein [Candidatus Poribacteria bacterium]|nr:PEGA domain-containing protein [Candidatus Poribacteria bacterium]
MLKPNTILAAIFISAALVIAVSVPAFSVDSGVHWLIVDATPDARAHELLNTLTELLTTRGQVPSEQIHRLAGDVVTTQEIYALLQEVGQQVQPDATLIFLFHGMVVKHRRPNAMHLLIPGDTQTIQDATLNQWFRESFEGRAVVILDGYSDDTDLNTYYANREILGSAALNVIQLAPQADATRALRVLNDALATDTTDTDENRQISIIETFELFRTDEELPNGVLAPTGDVEAALLKLSPAIKIETFPDGAQISINDVEVGSTPALVTENLQQGTSTVSVKKLGYHIPLPKTAELQLVLGESVRMGWVLQPIAIHGTVVGVEGQPVTGTIVWIGGTTHQQTLEADGAYRFDDWKDSGLLTLGETYTLHAKQGDLSYEALTFTFDGYTDIEHTIQLVKRTWFEIAQIAFDQNDHQGAIIAFQNGIEQTTDFPQMSPELTVLLLSSFADALDKQDVHDVNTLVVTAKLAEQHGQPDLAKRYWQELKAKARKGTPAAELASQRLWELNRARYLFNIGLVVVVVILITSGAWTYYRYRKTRQTVS